MEENQVENTLSDQADLTKAKLTEDGWIIRRPKRVKLTAEESIRRTEEFINDPKRREQFIASIRKSKD
ncbi:MAG: hypothetical protein ACRYFS_24365 [Janthinobacterium lividum]